MQLRCLAMTAALLGCFIVAACGDDSIREMSSLNGTSSYTDLEAQPFWPDLSHSASLSTRHPLYLYSEAARARKLPLRFFIDLIESKANVKVVHHSGLPSFRKYPFLPMRIYMNLNNTELDRWTNGKWANFYNELFHAWWDNNFLKDSKYAFYRKKLLRNEYLPRYREAHPREPRLAQEEGYSETIAAIVLLMGPQYNPNLPSKYGYIPHARFYYRKGYTVNAVDHEDRPGYRREATKTYLNHKEYRVLFWLLTDTYPPRPPQNTPQGHLVAKNNH